MNAKISLSRDFLSIKLDEHDNDIQFLFCFYFILNSIALCRLKCKRWPRNTSQLVHDRELLKETKPEPK